MPKPVKVDYLIRQAFSDRDPRFFGLGLPLDQSLVADLLASSLSKSRHNATVDVRQFSTIETLSETVSL